MTSPGLTKGIEAPPPAMVLGILETAIEREPVRGRAALAAYCTHLSLAQPACQDLGHRHPLEAAVRAVQLYTELTPTHIRVFQPFSAIADAAAAQAFRTAGLADIAIDHLRSAITTLRECPWDIDWWRTDLVRMHLQLAHDLITLQRSNEALNVVGDLLATIENYFTDPNEQLPADLLISVTEMWHCPAQLQCAGRPVGEGQR